MRSDPGGVVVIGCGAIARELLEVVRRNGLDHLTVECLPARLHNTPALIPEAVEARLVAARESGRTAYVAYGDCGTGGRLDALLDRYGVERLPGDHCYQFFMGEAAFVGEHFARPATFYLTDYLVRHFDRLVWSGLGLDRHPELLADYFGNYERVLYLAQSKDASLVDRARRCAGRLGLEFAYRGVGLGDVPLALAGLRAAAS